MTEALQSDQINKPSRLLSENTVKNILALDITESNGWETLSMVQKMRAPEALHSVQSAIAQKAIASDQLHKILDFGAGAGGPTFALTKIAELTGATVDAVEMHGVDRIVDAGIISTDHAFNQDGFAYLQQYSIKPEVEKYDLITAFMLGPESNYPGLIKKFIEAGGNALTKSGNLLITSDYDTIQRLENILADSQVDYQYIQETDEDGNSLGSDTVIIPASSCHKLEHINERSDN